MSSENKREELKAKINEELDELSLEELEQVAGGFGGSESTWTCTKCGTTITGQGLLLQAKIQIHESYHSNDDIQTPTGDSGTTTGGSGSGGVQETWTCPTCGAAVTGQGMLLRAKVQLHEESHSFDNLETR